nr:hypothetical protein [Tanacetum cinerariifolium]
MLNPTLDVGMESIFETTSQLDVQTLTSVAPLPITAPTMTPSTIATITTSQAPILPTTVPSNIIQNLPNFSSLFCFDDRLRSLEANFSKAMQTNQFAGAVSAIPGIINQYMDQQMNEVVKVAVQIQFDRLRDEAQRENEEFLKTVDENMQKIIKEQVKEQVKFAGAVSAIPGIVNQYMDQQMNEVVKVAVQIQFDRLRDEAQRENEEFLSSRTSYAVAADLSEMELKKILIEKIEGNKEIVTLKRRRDDVLIRMKNPPLDQTGETTTLNRAWNKTVPAVHKSIQPWISELAKQADTRSSFNELIDTPLDFFNFLINRLKVDTLTPELLAGPTYELMKGSCKSLVELEYHLEEVFKATTDQLDWVNPEGQQYPHNMLKPLPLIPINRGRRAIPFEHFIKNDLEYLRGGASSRYDKHALWGVSHWGRKRQQFYGFAVNWVSSRDVYSKRRIITITELKIIE